MRIEDNNFIPIILGTGLNAYGIARELHSHFGVKSLALGRLPLRETAYSKILEVRASEDCENSESLIKLLLELPNEFPGKKLLLIPTIERYTNTIVRNRALLSAKFKIPVVTQEIAGRITNKTDFYRTCAELNIPHPISTSISAKDLESGALEEPLAFPYPVILKPSDTENYPALNFVGRKKIYLIQNPAELLATTKMIYEGGYDGELIVQEFLSGDESIIMTSNTYSDQHGRTRFVTVGQVVLADNHPNTVGNMNAIITVDAPQIAATLTKFLDSVQYVGPANFDIMFDNKTGTHKLLEMNLRQGATSYYASATGHSLPACYVRDLIQDEQLPYLVTTECVLWRNVPTPIIRSFMPDALKPLFIRARKNRTAHTLWYSKDLSIKRIISLLKFELRTGWNATINEKYRINRATASF